MRVLHYNIMPRTKISPHTQNNAPTGLYYASYVFPCNSSLVSFCAKKTHDDISRAFRRIPKKARGKHQGEICGDLQE